MNSINRKFILSLFMVAASLLVSLTGNPPSTLAKVACFISVSCGILCAVIFAYKKPTKKRSAGDILQEVEAIRLQWSLDTFKEATAQSSLAKCIDEIAEIGIDLADNVRQPEEYADALMCLFDSAARQKVPITFSEIVTAYQNKVNINKTRIWVKNPNNSYSHKK